MKDFINLMSWIINFDCLLCLVKGQKKPKAVWARHRFSQKMNKWICFVCREKQKSKQNKFVCLFFGRIYGASICFYLTFTTIKDDFETQLEIIDATDHKYVWNITLQMFLEIVDRINHHLSIKLRRYRLMHRNYFLLP